MPQIKSFWYLEWGQIKSFIYLKKKPENFSLVVAFQKKKNHALAKNAENLLSKNLLSQKKKCCIY